MSILIVWSSSGSNPGRCDLSLPSTLSDGDTLTSTFHQHQKERSAVRYSRIWRRRRDIISSAGIEPGCLEGAKQKARLPSTATPYGYDPWTPRLAVTRRSNTSKILAILAHLLSTLAPRNIALLGRHHTPHLASTDFAGLDSRNTIHHPAPPPIAVSPPLPDKIRFSHDIQRKALTELARNASS